MIKDENHRGSALQSFEYKWWHVRRLPLAPLHRISLGGYPLQSLFDDFMDRLDRRVRDNDEPGVEGMKPVPTILIELITRQPLELTEIHFGQASKLLLANNSAHDSPGLKIEGGILLRPVAVVDRQKARRELMAIVERDKWIGPEPRPSPEEEEQFIFDEVAAARDEA